MLSTKLNLILPTQYDSEAEIAQKANKEVTTKEMAVKLGYVTSEEFEEWAKPENMVGKILLLILSIPQ